jgi:hypothetical protein
VFRCFSGHGEKIISILVELHSKRKEDSFLCMKDIRSINVELAANQDMFFFLSLHEWTTCDLGKHIFNSKFWRTLHTPPGSTIQLLQETAIPILTPPHSKLPFDRKAAWAAPFCAWQQPPNLLDSSSMVYTIPQSWTALAALHLACNTLSHSSSCTFSSQLDSSFSSPPSLLQQPAAAGQLLDNSFSSCSFWQHLQGAEPLLDNSMGCTCPPHQQHLQGSSMGRHSTAGTAPILSFPQAGSEENKRGEKRRSSGSIMGQKIFAGQQGDGRVFNTKFSKALHA